MPDVIAVRNGKAAADEAGRPRYDFEIDLDTRSTHPEVVGRDRRVLELGCAIGDMSRILPSVDHGSVIASEEQES
jgi:hypothetical protein